MKLRFAVVAMIALFTSSAMAGSGFTLSNTDGTPYDFRLDCGGTVETGSINGNTTRGMSSGCKTLTINDKTVSVQGKSRCEVKGGNISCQ